MLQPKKTNGNPEAVNDAYNLFVETGYNKSKDDFVQLLQTNPEALKDAHKLFTDTGYKKDINAFSDLLGLKKKDASVSAASDGSSGLPKNSTAKPSKYSEGTMAWNQEKLLAADPHYSDLYKRYKAATAVSDERKAEIKQEVDAEAAGDGVWNNVVRGAKSVWNTAADALTAVGTTLGTFGTAIETRAPEGIRANVDPLQEEKNQAKKELQNASLLAKKNKKPVTPITQEAITERAKAIAVNKRIKSQQNTNVREFLANAQNEIDSNGESNKQKLAMFEAGEQSRFSENDKLLLQKQNLLRPAIESKMATIKQTQQQLQSFKKTGATPPAELIDKYKNDVSEYQSLLDDVQKTHDEYVNNTKDLGDAIENLNVFKRDYSWGKNFTNNLLATANELSAGVDGAIDYTSQFTPSPIIGMWARDNAKHMRSRANELRDEVMKPIAVDDINNMKDFGKWLSNTVVAQQVPIYAIIATGVPGIASIGVTSAGQKYEDMQDETDAGTNSYNDVQKTAIPLLFGATETASAAVDSYLLKNAARVIRSATEPERQLMAKGFTDYLLGAAKFGKEALKGGAYEAVDESLTQLSQNVIDIYAGDKKDVQLWDNVKDAAAAGAAMGVMLPFGGNIVAAAVKPFSTDARIQAATAEVMRLEQTLGNPELSETTRSVIEKQLTDAETKQKQLLEKAVRNVSEMDNEAFNRVLQLEREQATLRSNANEISTDPSIDNDTRKMLLENLNADFNANEAQRVELLNKSKQAAPAEAPSTETNTDTATETTQPTNPDNNESIPANDTATDGNIRPEPAVVGETATTGQDTATEAIQPANDTSGSESTSTFRKEYRLGLNDKAGIYTVTFENGRLNITDSNGNEPSATTRRKIEEKYANDFDFTVGKTAPRIESNVNPNEYIAATSENPSEIAEALVSIDTDNLINDNISYRDRIISENLGLVSRQSYIEHSDANNITAGLAKSYLRNNGRPLDSLAQEMSEKAGIEITEQDIVDFINENPGGVQQFISRIKRGAIDPLKQRFTDLTGLPATDKYLQKAIEQKNFKDNFTTSINYLSDEELLAVYAEMEQFNNETNGGQETDKSINSGTEGISGEKNSGEISTESTVQSDGGAENIGNQSEKITNSDNSVTEPDNNTTTDEGTALKNADIAQKRNELGLEQRDDVTRKANATTVDQAKQKIADGYDVETLIDDILEGNRTLTDEEVVILKQYQLAKENALVTVSDAIVETTRTGQQTNLDKLIDERDGLINDIDRAYRAGEQSGTVTARALQARRIAMVTDYSLANMLIQKRKANNGERLTSEQIQATTDEYNRIRQLNDELTKKLESLEEENNRLRAQKQLSSLERVARNKNRKQKVEEIDKSIEDTLASLKEKIREQRQRLNANPLPIELVPDIAKLALLYTQKGVVNLSEVVDNIYATLVDDIPEIQKKDIEEIISKYDYEAEAKEQQRLDAMKNRTRKKIDELEDRTARKDFAKQTITPIKLDAEALELKDRLRKAKFEWQRALERDRLARRTKSEKIKDNITNIGNVPRTVMASIDFSAPLRQGLVMTVNHPILASKAFVEMFRQAVNQTRFDRWLADLKESPAYEVMEKSGLYISDNASAELSAREELFMTNLADKIPVLGKGFDITSNGRKVRIGGINPTGGLNLIGGSERAYVSYLNKLRSDVFLQAMEQFEKDGKTFDNSPELYTAMAKYVNATTGRGELGGVLKDSAGILNVAFFSPRLIASRIQLLTNWANPYWYAKTPAKIRQMYALDMLKLVAFGTTVLALAAAAGADVEDDPRSSDFGKIRVDDTRWDIWGGFQQFVRFFAQLATGQKKSTTSGRITTFGKGYKSDTRADVIIKMLRSKMAPVPATAWNLADGRNMVGEKFELQDVPESFLPLFAKDLYKAIERDGVGDATLKTGLPGAFGVGVQTYKDK